MWMQNKLSVVLGAAALTLGAFASTASYARGGDQEIEFRCRARAPGGVKLAARYEERIRRRGSRIKFNAEFEARPGGAFSAGQAISISVDSVQVGTVELALSPLGELSGELELDSRPQAGHTPLPSNFPDAGEGSTVTAKANGNEVLSCDLR